MTIRKVLGRAIGLLVIVGAALAAGSVWNKLNEAPRTDDAEVFANVIGIAPEVGGRITRVAVQDNDFVHKGDVLFEIDPEPFRFALESARSAQATLEAQIRDLQRSIGSQESAVTVAASYSRVAEAKIATNEAAAKAAQSAVDAAKAAVAQAEADLAYAENNVARLEPLLAKQFVTVDAVDAARTARSVKAETVRSARARVSSAEAQLAAATSQEKEARAEVERSSAQVEQSRRSVALTDPLIAQRAARAAAVESAAYDLARCKVVTPFDARVVNLTISEGAYAKAGQQVFTLIDTRTWWVIANFRETELPRVRPGMDAEVYVMSSPGVKMHGVIDSAGFGVTPDAALVGNLSQGLPDVQRSLNWVHLATRFPVRVRMDAEASANLRMGASAIVTIRGGGK